MSVGSVLVTRATATSDKDSDGGDGVAVTDDTATATVMEGIATLSEEDKIQECDVQNTVGVIVRVRPLSTVEHADPSVKSVVNCLKDSIVVNGALSPSSRYFGARNAQPRPQHFKVDKVFHPHSTQIEVYEACRSIVAGVFDGMNGSILAYGATGSGKTHTMFGGSMSVAGVIYQAVQDILEAKERLEMEDDKTVTVRCTFLEVYNEEVFDLLAPSSPRGKRKALKVQDLGHDDMNNNNGEEGGNAGVNPESLNVKGLTYFTPETAEDFAKCVEQGHTNRFVAATNANAQSSRSHAILTMEVEVKDRVDATLGTVGRIRFCDLAGSERAAGTSNSGIRLREGGNINRSLLALAAVVQALAQRKKHHKRAIYVPYRGSKLTRLLRDCLGGNCRTLMLFCVSPSSVQYEETVNTMLFAMRAKEIQVAAKRHEFKVDSKEVAKSQEALIEDLRMELALARDELLRLKGGTYTSNMGRTPFSTLSQPLPLNSPSVAPLSSRRGDVQVLSAGPLTFETEGRPDSLEASPAHAPPSHRVSFRMSVMAEGSEAYTELQNKLKTFSVAKETLYREMREAEQSNSELDMRLRQHKWKLARFLSTRKRNSNTGADGVKVTPVGVAGLRHAIEQMEAESAAQGGEMKRLLEKMNATDRTIANIRGELLRERQHPLLELLLDNVKLRQSCTEAECLAAHYHQECRSSMNREEEYAQSLGICVSAIRHMLPLACSNPALLEEAQLALIFANLPSLSTTDMIAVFERSMNTGSAPSTLFLDSFRSASPVVSMEARLERMVQDRTPGKDTTARPLPLRKIKRNGVVGTLRKDKVSRTTDVRSNNLPVAPKKTRTGPEPFVSSYSTTGLRRLAANGTAPLRRSPDSTNAFLRPTDGKKSVSFAAAKKGASPNGLPSRHTSSTAAGSATAATRTGVKSGVKMSAAPTPFARSHTASEALHGGHRKNGNALSLANRGSSHERERKPRLSPPSRAFCSPKKENGDTARQKRNHVTFTPSGDDGRTSTSTAAGALATPKKRLHNADLVERYDKLLSEVRQWHHEVGNAAVRNNHAARDSVSTP
ncbi:putative kinesin [Trypanosoma theileri]|uniref:Putative kinesin n=1 Tax=Trypanosoma theileri TaxID=67003 RepID=A0A1X0NV15_9TRYP|nr:putative kinesin [Trypanosoma theileri]ORC88522.1 putative kinesin [Trypanosoma theileri]